MQSVSVRIPVDIGVNGFRLSENPLKKGIRCRPVQFCLSGNSGTVLAAVIGIETSKFYVAIGRFLVVLQEPVEKALTFLP